MAVVWEGLIDDAGLRKHLATTQALKKPEVRCAAERFADRAAFA